MIKLNVGCGKRNFGSDWEHIDGANFPHIKWNDVFLRNYQPDSVDVIYTSHLIAYFDRDEIIELLSCWREVLKTDGVLRLATPDIDSISELYRHKLPIEKILGPMYGKMQIGNKTIYHKTVYDLQSLTGTLISCGFKNVRLYDHKKTDHAQYDDHSAAYIDGKLISLNVECNK